jgi:hypothetical protein
MDYLNLAVWPEKLTLRQKFSLRSLEEITATTGKLLDCWLFTEELMGLIRNFQNAKNSYK